MARDVDYGTDEAGRSISSLVTVCLLLLVRCRFCSGSRSFSSQTMKRTAILLNSSGGQRPLFKALQQRNRRPSRAKTNIARAGPPSMPFTRRGHSGHTGRSGLSGGRTTAICSDLPMKPRSKARAGLRPVAQDTPDNTGEASARTQERRAGSLKGDFQASIDLQHGL